MPRSSLWGSRKGKVCIYKSSDGAGLAMECWQGVILILDRQFMNQAGQELPTQKRAWQRP